MCRTCSSFNLKYSTLYTGICLKSHTFNTFAALLIIKVVFNTKNVFFVKLGNINQISFFVQNRRLQMSSISNETYLASSLSFLVKHIFFRLIQKTFLDDSYSVTAFKIDIQYICIPILILWH